MKYLAKGGDALLLGRQIWLCSGDGTGHVLSACPIWAEDLSSTRLSSIMSMAISP